MGKKIFSTWQLRGDRSLPIASLQKISGPALIKNEIGFKKKKDFKIEF